MKNHVVVVIPVYQKELSYYELVSLKQAHRLLHKYNKIFVAPESLVFDYGTDYEVKRFRDAFFASTKAYSDLLMSDEFYACFSQYEYLLIYQLDAFVFSDQVDFFCHAGYDYIGAPINTGDWCKFHVGNGGLSLRKITSARRVLKDKKKILERIKAEIHPDRLDEDVFFGYCGSATDIDFSVPHPRFAATFSVQNDYAHGLRDINKNGLPFGCHCWVKYNYNFWKPYIESYGYKLPTLKSKSSLMNDSMKRMFYLAKRYIRRRYQENDLKTVFRELPRKRSYCIYGGGVFGKLCLEFIEALPIDYKITRVYDNAVKESTINDIPIIRPMKEELLSRKEFIIIATLDYRDEIAKQLSCWGLRDKLDFDSIYDICSRLIGDYKSFCDNK